MIQTNKEFEEAGLKLLKLARSSKNKRKEV
jgi:hypothetical protein